MTFSSDLRPTRRGFALGMLTAAASTAAIGQALARDPSNTFGDSAEWVQKYDASAGMRVARSSVPVLSPQTVAATEQAIEQYRSLVAQGGWRPVQAGGLKLGSRGPAVAALRQRLIVSGDLDSSAAGSQVYDSYVEAAVRRLQTRHGLNASGAINGPTLAAMNVPADMRLRQLETNIVRLRSFSGSLGHRYVVANIPAALVETVENDVVATRHSAGVGKIDRQSPILQTRIPEVNFNPTWTVPVSIIKKDLIPKMRTEPNYLTENRIRIIGPNGQEIPPSSVNWRSDEATRYTFRQDPGGDFNSLGFVRINIPSPHGVYMHDTPAKGVFGDDFRFVSSGCMRVQNVRDYVEWLLKDTPGWNRQHIDQVMTSGERINARLSEPVPIYWIYITAWGGPDGIIQFRDDIYNKDGLGPVPMARAEIEQ